jgi:hypothetical protein
MLIWMSVAKAAQSRSRLELTMTGVCRLRKMKNCEYYRTPRVNCEAVL